MVSVSAAEATAVLLVAEVYESLWQSAPTLGALLGRVRAYWRRHLFVLFFMHPSLWWTLFLYVAYGFNGTLLGMMVVMKASDLALKIWMVQRLEEGRVSPEMAAMLSQPLAPWMPWINVLIYPFLLSLALGS